MANSENQVIEIIPALLVGDSTFDQAAIPSSTLCIEMSDQNVRFCIVKEENMECIWLEDYALEQTLSEEEIFERLRRIFTGHMLWSSAEWKGVCISVNSTLFSLVPNVLFDPEKVGEYLSFSAGNPIADRDMVLYHDLPLVHAKNIFSIPRQWHEWIINHFRFSRVTFYHFTSPIITGALVSHVEQQEVRIASLCFEKDMFTLVVSESQRLILCNRFKFKEVQEMAYIVLFTLGQLGYEPEQMKVMCYGEVSASAEVFVELSHFFPHIQIGGRPTTLRYSSQCAEVPGHRYFGLFNTYLVSS
ncbi:DUF3822 family protein [Dyadobacter aurulentus]|uniref:DUF3822 family protein n=1 Tax=Dyadobacter sp. UC 10 TaxID=2605428 RepID=UPI0011F2E8AA|nr:DUF3822 family protein [Dyadobacter sp. UC 10]KAA0993728.1 DUF3822 family protein [Dyadobacter sp. UC 10]